MKHHTSKFLLTLVFHCLVIHPSIADSVFQNSSKPLIEPKEGLALADAIALTLGHSPHLEPFSWDIRIQEAEAIQAAARPNPELAFELENAFGDGIYSGTDVAEKTLSIGQLIELGRKLAKRIDVAEQSVKLASQSYLIKRTEVLNAVVNSFLEALAAQQNAEFAEATLQLEEQLATAQEERLQAGKISGLEVENGKTALALAKIELETARRALKQSKLRLTAHWGNPNPKFKHLEGTLNIDPVVPEAEVYRENLDKNPILEFAARLIEKQRASLALEESSRVPDLTAGVGLRRFRESRDNAMVFQFSLPLPLFDRNRGNIQKAQAELSKARATHKSTQVMLETTFSEAYERLLAGHQETAAIIQSVLPSAQSGFELAQESYQLGKFSYFELKTAQTILIDSRKKLLSAQLRYHKAKADLEMLAGKTL